ncbi:AAEL001453-PA [Aedes aegypti]|uniref:AAEL001453-PA n=1 Tax=Aedes aegypti TaxID=7159 RepID=Q17L60_AEDAE|nr:AAEL001453-PA [Aedes aegypti]
MEYQAIAHKLSKKDRNPLLFKIKIFAPAQIVPKCHFWCFMRQLCQFKKTTSEIVLVKRILEKTPLRLMNLGRRLRRRGFTTITRRWRALCCGLPEGSGCDRVSSTRLLHAVTSRIVSAGGQFRVFVEGVRSSLWSPIYMRVSTIAGVKGLAGGPDDDSVWTDGPQGPGLELRCWG